MIPRSVLAFLLLALPALLVVFAVVMGGFGLAHAGGDALAAGVLWWIGMATLMILAVDLILLVGVVSIETLLRKPDDEEEDELDGE